MNRFYFSRTNHHYLLLGKETTKSARYKRVFRFFLSILGQIMELHVYLLKNMLEF